MTTHIFRGKTKWNVWYCFNWHN